jgi:predicted nuclease with RNAse H fold
VITLGIDLASQPRATAACTIEWRDGRGRVLDVACGQDDEALVARIASADKVGIDVPFGWPDAFVQAVARFHAGDAWPEASLTALRFRQTDRIVAARTGRWPLSVSTDLIGVPTFRAARLLARLAAHGLAIDRAGDGRLVETYPAAALRLWGFAATGYKRRAGRPSLARLLAELARRTHRWLDLDSGVRRLCGASDDALDALVAALVARAAALGLCERPPAEHAAAAAREGWIGLPAPEALDRLAEPQPWRRSSARKRPPNVSSFQSPTPLTSRRASSVVGRRRAMSRSEASLKTR